MEEGRILKGRGSDAPVEAAFRRWLVGEGWCLVQQPGSWADVIATRGEARLVAEVKGRTGSNMGIDVDTMFGQLLRRMDPGVATDWAVVVPSAGLSKVLRVPLDVRRRLGIRVFEVREDDSVIEHLA